MHFGFLCQCSCVRAANKKITPWSCQLLGLKVPSIIMGYNLMAGQWTLTPYVKVRFLLPQPMSHQFNGKMFRCQRKVGSSILLCGSIYAQVSEWLKEPILKIGGRDERPVSSNLTLRAKGSIDQLSMRIRYSYTGLLYFYLSQE